MRAHVLHSFRTGSPTGGIARRPFLLDQAAKREASRFEVDLVLEGVRHEYGFALDDDHVLEEWAYRYPHGKAVRLFHRWGNEVELGSAQRVKGRAVLELLRPNALFLSTAASANHPVLLPIYAWFARDLWLAEASSREFRQALTTQLLDDDARRGQVLALLRAADLGITGAKKYQLDPVVKDRLQRAVRILAGQEGDLDSVEEGPAFDQLGVLLTHRGAGGRHRTRCAGRVARSLLSGSVLFGPGTKGTRRRRRLARGRTRRQSPPCPGCGVIRLFQDPKSNPRRAQLVFNTHDATILGDSTSDRLIGRDQVWFTEKRADGVHSPVPPFSDLDPRKEEADRPSLPGRPVRGYANPVAPGVRRLCRTHYVRRSELSRGRASGPPQRRPSKAALLPELLVFVEGLRLQEIYLTYWRRQYRDRVRVEIDDYRGGPLQLVERAVEAQRIGARDARKGRGRAHDQIWCMSFIQKPLDDLGDKPSRIVIR